VRVDRRRVLATAATAALAAAGTTGLSAAAGPVARQAGPPRITPAGVGQVRLGETYTYLHSRRLVGALAHGCSSGGPNTRSANLSSPLKGSVNFTLTSPRKVASISITGGATARGVGIGASLGAVRRAFPRAVVDHSTDRTFGFTLVRVPASGGGRLAFGLDTLSKRVVLIGVPSIPTCD
jgi:hypothetical protein